MKNLNLIFSICLFTCLSYGTEDIFEAAKDGDLEYFKLLAQKEISLDLANERGKTALHLAAQYGRLETVQFLLVYGLNINEKDKNGDSPLHLASRYQKAPVVKLLLKMNANAFIQNYSGRLAFTELKKAMQKNYDFRQEIKESFQSLQRLKNERLISRARDNRNLTLSKKRSIIRK